MATSVSPAEGPVEQLATRWRGALRSNQSGRISYSRWSSDRAEVQGWVDDWNGWNRHFPGVWTGWVEWD